MALDLDPYLNKLHHRRARQHTDTLNRLNGLRPPPIMVGDRAGEPWFDDEVEALCHEIMRLSREAHLQMRPAPGRGGLMPDNRCLHQRAKRRCCKPWGHSGPCDSGSGPWPDTWVDEVYEARCASCGLQSTHLLYDEAKDAADAHECARPGARA